MNERLPWFGMRAYPTLGVWSRGRVPPILSKPARSDGGGPCKRKKENRMKRFLPVVLLATAVFAGCATAVDSALFGNAAKAHIYTPEEQAGMTPEGTLETMTTPSEIRERFRNAGKFTKPTGEVNYCDAGMASLVQSRREAALAAIDEACGGKGQYVIRREGPGFIQARQIGDVRLGSSCNRSRALVFRCNGVQPKPGMRQ